MQQRVICRGVVQNGLTVSNRITSLQTYKEAPSPTIHNVLGYLEYSNDVRLFYKVVPSFKLSPVP